MRGTLIGMTSQRVAGGLFIAAGIVGFLGQFIALLMWTGGPYSLQFNLISDLGMTTCAPVADSFISRYVCSPGHGWFNAGMIVSGVALVVGGLLLRRTPGFALAISGAALAVLGFFPFDHNAAVHDSAAVIQALTTWVAMVAVIIRAQNSRRMLSTVTAILLVVSVLGFGLLLLLPEGAPGLYERISFDLLSVWTIFFGAVLLGRGRPRAPRKVDPEAAERDAAIRKAARELG